MRLMFFVLSLVAIGVVSQTIAGAAEAKKGASLSDCTGQYSGVTVKPNAAAPGAKLTVTMAPGVYSNSPYGGASAVSFVTLIGEKCKTISPIAGSSQPSIPFAPPAALNVPVRTDFCSFPEPGPWYVVVSGRGGPIGAAQFVPICSPIVVPSGGYKIPPLPGGPPAPK